MIRPSDQMAHASLTLEQILTQERQLATEMAADGPGLWRLGLVAIAAGGLTGVVGAAFRLLLERAEEARAALVAWSAAAGPVAGLAAPVAAAAACAAAARALVRLAPEASGSGVQRVEAEMRGEEPPARPRVVGVKFVGGTLALGGGLALGREGPTVQMGATIGGTLARWAGLSEGDVRCMSAAVAGAGLGVAFGAPAAGVVFVFEEVRRAFSARLMVAGLLGCCAAAGIARPILGDAPDFTVPSHAIMGWATLPAMVVFGVLLGALGVSYNRLVLALLEATDRLRLLPEAKAAAIGAAMGALASRAPLLAGPGEILTQSVLSHPAAPGWLAAALAVRWLAGPLSYAAGTPGGLFAPLLALGSAAGALYAGLASRHLGVALDPTAFAIVGMSTFFTAVVRAPLTGIVLIVEMTATTTLLTPMLATAGVAVATATALRGLPIYDTLRLRMLKREAAAKAAAPGRAPGSAPP